MFVIIVLSSFIESKDSLSTTSVSLFHEWMAALVIEFIESTLLKQGMHKHSNQVSKNIYWQAPKWPFPFKVDHAKGC